MTLPIAWMVPALTLIAQQPALNQTATAAPNLIEDIACAPMSPSAPPLGGMTVSGSYAHGRIMFGPGEALIVNAGSRQGLQTGQMFYVRRHVRDMFTPASVDFTPVSIHTAGWVTIVEVKDDVAVARVTHACDGVLDGDYLEPYTDPVAPAAILGGEPDYAHPARIVMADEKMQTGAAGTLMLINRGSDHGVHAGQSLTIFRDTLAGAGPVFEVGRALILSVRPQTSLIRVEASRDAVYIGDLAAIHHIQP